ncbi:MAG: hypothetical protein KTR31_11345 [Myxococcales bacterium]|nr:hypothetical protein [Myxococcales bacterium]
MRPQLRRAVAFVVCAAVLHVGLSLVYARTVGRAHDARRMDARWLFGPRPVAVLVAGDSHARFGVEAPLLGSAINVAVPGEHYLKTLYRLPWLLRKGRRRVTTVLLPFDAASFSGFKTDSFEPEFVWGRYVDYLEVGRRKGDLLSYLGRWSKARLAPYAGELITSVQYVTATKHFRRGQTGPGSGLVVFENGVQAARRHFARGDPFDRDMVWAFRRILTGCRRAGLRVVLVRYPVTRGYARESRRLGGDPSLRDELVGEFAQEGTVDHLDFEGLYFDQPDLFGDGDHLNVFGKRAFTTELRSALVELGVLPASPAGGGG